MGGSTADLQEFPYVVRIVMAADDGLTVKILCTGVLITINHVLTISRCITRLAPALVVVDNLNEVYMVYSIQADESQNLSILKVKLILKQR